MPKHLLNGSIASAYGTGGVVTSILQAFLRTSPGIAPRACGRRCLAGNHLRTWCPPNKPTRLGSGSGKPGSNPGGASQSPISRFVGSGFVVWIRSVVDDFLTEDH